MNDWQHVPPEDNVTDYISRGQFPSQFIGNQEWLNGPSWLLLDEVHWPHIDILEEDVPEQCTSATLNILNTDPQIMKHFSSIRSLNRFVFLCLRLLANKKDKQHIEGELTAFELDSAHSRILKLIQQKHFTQELSVLKKGNEIFSTSKLLCLTPFIDELRIMRGGGRLKHATVSNSQKLPFFITTK